MVLDHEWFCERAEKEISTLAATVSDAPDAALDVPTCPGWTLGELARHTGTIHRWTTTIVATEAAGRLPFPEVDSPWSSADGWGQWLAAGATRIDVVDASSRAMKRIRTPFQMSMAKKLVLLLNF